MHDIELFALLLYLFELPQNKMHCNYENSNIDYTITCT